MIDDQPTVGDDRPADDSGDDARGGNPVAQIVPVDGEVANSSSKADAATSVANSAAASIANSVADDDADRPAVFAVEVREADVEVVATALAEGSAAGVILRTC